MAHENEGRFAKKHPSGTKPDERIAMALRTRASEGGIPCSIAFGIAQELSVQQSEVGRTADLLEIPIIKCQLGLFGYESPKKIVKSVSTIDPNLEKAINQAMVDDRFPCAAAFSIAEQLRITKITVSSTCESLGIRISSCQLGVF